MAMHSEKIISEKVINLNGQQVSIEIWDILGNGIYACHEKANPKKEVIFLKEERANEWVILGDGKLRGIYTETEKPSVSDRVAERLIERIAELTESLRQSADDTVREMLDTEIEFLRETLGDLLGEPKGLRARS